MKEFYIEVIRRMFTNGGYGWKDVSDSAVMARNIVGSRHPYSLSWVRSEKDMPEYFLGTLEECLDKLRELELP